MDNYRKLISHSLDHFSHIKFDKQNPWHRNMVALYCSIVEYSDSLSILAKEEREGFLYLLFCAAY